MGGNVYVELPNVFYDSIKDVTHQQCDDYFVIVECWWNKEYKDWKRRVQWQFDIIKVMNMDLKVRSAIKMPYFDYSDSKLAT
ncbi:unnamed protein product [Haemonchus placei]|uniref:Uncharacterized protein n=1 Tax=Haemonchus placei TaxID=6290 RepID=A0A0N4W1F3_HAEPC|nr:unnamed protein product [Haemonchus placei]